MASESSVLVEEVSPHILRLRIHRPKAKNALNEDVRQRLQDAFRSLSTDVRCVILAGGADFAAGADIRDMVEKTPTDLLLKNSESFWRTIAECPVPIVAAVKGLAWGGGCELAMHADIIIAGESASFAQPEVKLGVMPGAGGTQRLIRAVGKFNGLAMLLTGRSIDARKAERIGLVTEVVSDEHCDEVAVNYAVTIANLPPLAVRQIKEVALAGQELPLDGALKLERKAFQLLFDTQDQKEGMRSFLEKRKPEYRGQ